LRVLRAEIEDQDLLMHFQAFTNGTAGHAGFGTIGRRT